MARKIKGLRRHGRGFQTFCRVNGEYRSATWPLDTPVSEMSQWLREQRATKTKSARSGSDSFSRAATLYLEKVTALRTFRQRKRHLDLWAAVFAGVRRRSITSAQIRGQRDRWLLEGLAPHTVNLRLRALSNLWTVLDGRRAPNPARDVPEATEPDLEPRSIPYWLAQRIVDRFPRRAARPRAMLHIMVTTGLTPVEIARLKRQDWRQQSVYVQARRKGQGGVSRTIPLTEEAQDAFRAFSDAQGWGRLPNCHFYQQFRRTCQRVARDPLVIDTGLRERIRTLRPYDLRHTYATMLYAISGDAHAAAQLLGHRSTATTQRYIAAALAERMSKAVQWLEQEVASQPRQIL